MKGAAAARLGKDQTPGRAMVSGPRYTGRGADRFGQADVFGPVADHPGGGQVEVERGRRGSGQARAWLAVSLVRAKSSTTPSGW